MYPLPRQAAADSQAGNEQTQCPENPRTEGAVKPATGEDADQDWGHDRPAERSDHCEVLSDRPFALALPAFQASPPQARRLVETLGVIGPLFRGRWPQGWKASGDRAAGPPGMASVPSARRKRTICRIAARERRCASVRAACS